MAEQPAAAIAGAEAAARRPLAGHQPPQQALAQHQQQRQATGQGQPPPPATGGCNRGIERHQPLMAGAEQGHQQQGGEQVGRHHGGGQQLQHREGAEAGLYRHQQHTQHGQRRLPGRQLAAPPQAGGRQHQQAHAHHKGIEAVEPFQEHLQVHLPARQQRAVAEGPVGTGQACLHHPGGPTDRHQGDQGDQQVGGQTGQPRLQKRGRGRPAGITIGDGSAGLSLQGWGNHRTPRLAIDVKLTMATRHA